MIKLLPRTLLWRTFVLIAALILLAVAAWFELFRFSEREPRARQTADLVASVVNLTRVALVTAQHDRVVASYAVLNAVGRLSPTVMKLNTNVYDPSVHYHQVRDSWAGVRTPDGR